MKKRPIFFCLAVCLFAISVMTAYFTMYCNVHGLDMFLNRTLGGGERTAVPVITTGTNTFGVTPSKDTTPTPEIPETTQTPEPSYTDITLAFAGDFLIHENILTAQYNEETNTYSFGTVFSQITGELAKADFVAGSLEVPFGGKEAGAYTGYPRFNCPDPLAEAFKENNIRLLFTAGVHAFDAGSGGMTRTIATLQQNGLLSTGTREKNTVPNYVIADVKGVQVGFINYTVGDRRSDGKIHANGTTLSQEQEDCINIFTYNELDTFYTKLETELTAMKAAGAEVLVVSIRWGTDYTTVVDGNQKAMAQKLCDMGVDIIVGNGSHMVQPFEALTSQLSGKTTLCMYSLGNFLSNQRKELLRYDSGHTEDGILYTINIRKQADGTIILGTVQYVPTWVSLTGDENGKSVYEIMPLTEKTELKEAADSYKRTQDIVAEGVIKYNNSVSNY